MQVFYWKGPGTQKDGKVFYQAFALNGVNYKIGDSVYLYPEDENYPHYIGRIVSAFVDEHSGNSDPHCIQVKWYERRVNLEQHTRGIEESEREVFELEDIDVNPIGCISGKNCIVRARSYEEAHHRMQGSQMDWYFCRGYFLQASNSFKPYSPAELAIMDGSQAEDNVEVMEQEAEPPRQYNRAPPVKRKTSGGRMCEECGATSTPQWREGPTGPRTLCNACGLRYCRAHQRQQKRSGGGSGGRGRGGARYGGAVPRQYVRKGRKEMELDDLDDEDDEELEDEEDEDEDVDTLPPPRREPRPMRQAAKAAVARTALFAQTGEFPAEPKPDTSPQVGFHGAPGDMLGQDRSGKKPRMSNPHEATFLPSDVKLEGDFSAQLPIAALDLPGALPDSGLQGALALPGGPVKLQAAAANLLASLGGPEAKGLEVGSPRLLAATHLGSPKAGSQLLHPPSALKPEGVAAAGQSPLAGIASAEIASILGMSLTPTSQAAAAAGAAGASGGLSLISAARGGLSTASGGDGPAAAASFDPASLVPPILTKSSPANGVASSAQAQEQGPEVLSAPGSALLQGSGMPGASPLGAEVGGGLGHLLPLSQPGSASTSAWGALQSPLAPDNPLSMLGGSDLGGMHRSSAPDAQDAFAQAIRGLEDVSALETMFTSLDSLPAGSLPPEAAVQLAEVREKVEAARKEAAAADAAVSAVSAVYAARQEAADKAREMAANAGQRLKEYLSTLVSEHKPALQGSAPVTADAWPAVDGTAGPGGAAGGLTTEIGS